MLSRQGPVRHTPVQYEVCTAWYNYTRRDGTTNAGTLQSRNGTKIRTVHDLTCTVPPCCRLVVRAVWLLSNLASVPLNFLSLDVFVLGFYLPYQVNSYTNPCLLRSQSVLLQPFLDPPLGVTCPCSVFILLRVLLPRHVPTISVYTPLPLATFPTAHAGPEGYSSRRYSTNQTTYSCPGPGSMY